MEIFNACTLIILVASSCAGALVPARAIAARPDYPRLAGATDEGRAVWIDSCEGCHAYAIAGSPNPLDPNDWRERLIKPRAVLYAHAIDGFFGPDDTQMPARGGNDSLSDEQVRAAVDYMIALANHHLNLPKENHDSRSETNR